MTAHSTLAAARLLTVKEVAQRCNCSERTVRRWIDQGDFLLTTSAA